MSKTLETDEMQQGDSAPATSTSPYCVFMVGTRRVGVEMTSIRENIDWPEYSPVPLTPPFVYGLINLRGVIIPAIDLSLFVGTESEKPGPTSRAIVVDSGQFRFATVADHIVMVEADQAAFKPHPQSALFPALESEVVVGGQTFDSLHLERLSAAMVQALRFQELGL